MELVVNVSSWGWPQWVTALTYPITLAMVSYVNGQPKTGKHSFWETLAVSCISFFILTAGGYFA